MKVLFYSQEFFPLENPTFKRVYGLSKHLKVFGVDVDIVCGFNEGFRQLFKFFSKKNYKGIDVYYYYAFPLIKRLNFLRGLHHLTFLLSSQLHNLRFKCKYDIVITTSPPALVSFGGLWIAKCKKAKLVYDVRDIWPDVAIEMEIMDEKSFMYKVFNYIAQKMYLKADLITTVTKLKQYNLINKGIPKEKVKLISNGFDLEFKENKIDNDIITKYKLSEKFTIIYTGNIGLAQGLDLLIDLGEKLKDNDDIQIILIGEGVEKVRLQKEVNLKGLTNIYFLSKMPQDKIYTFLKCAKLSFISLKNSNLQDSVPTKLLEALGVGCPVLLAASGEAKTILEESTLGECIKPENKKDLLPIFYKIYHNYEEYEKRKEVSINYIENNFSRKRQALKLLNELKVIIK